MSVVYPQPLTALRDQAQRRRKPITTKVQDNQRLRQLTVLSESRKASVIQRVWRKYTIRKTKHQQEMIRGLVEQTSDVPKQIAILAYSNQELGREIHRLQESSEEIQQRQRAKQQERIIGVYCKAFNGNIDHQVLSMSLQEQSDQSGQRAKEGEAVLSNMMSCLHLLQEQEEQLALKEKQCQHLTEQLQNQLLSQRLEVDRLEFQRQELASLRHRAELQTKYQSYL